LPTFSATAGDLASNPMHQSDCFQTWRLLKDCPS